MTQTPLPPAPPSSPVPAAAWSRPLGLGWERPYTVRYASNIDDGPWQGMPLGGFGAGCFGRSPRGDINLWQIDGGDRVFRSLPSCQFSIFEQGEGKAAQAYALSTEAADDGSLGAWQWYPPSTGDRTTGTYSALYPRSWFEYEGVFDCQIRCEQFSPIIPGNYQETSYPVAIFEWSVHNPTDRPITLSLMLSWENVVGWFTNAIAAPEVKVRDDGSPEYEYQPRWGESAGNFSRWIEDFYRVGCTLMNVQDLAFVDAHPGEAPPEGRGQWAIVTVQNPAVEVSYHTHWNPAGDGADLWQDFARTGSLPDEPDETPAQPGERVGAAIAVRFTVQPGRTRKVPFVIAWDFPTTEFAAGVNYQRRYTDFFGRNGTNAWTIARTALKHYEEWREKIQAWQAPILDRPDWPDWFKMALFNELYDLSAGGSLWTAADERDPKGQFAVLECMDYRWYESLDVRLYGSFGLLQLWPELEKAVMRAFARAIPTADDTPRVIGYNQAAAVRKLRDATPHDLGAPNEHPWERSNYTSYQDCNLWKDLGSDFVLLVYRDYGLTGGTDVEFLAECWGSVVRALDYLKGFDGDGDGIPENSGAPDQTFDDWRLQGVSAYCGGLWIAALEAAIAIADILLAAEGSGQRDRAGTLLDPQGVILDPEEIRQARDRFSQWRGQARSRYDELLWNGQYYRLDSASNSDVVMADQLCGQFYARLLNLPDVVPADRARTAIEHIYQSCFVAFNDFCRSDRAAALGWQCDPNGPAIGIANGVLADGSPENPKATHPLEVWTGINFGLAAFWLQMGFKAEAFEVTEAVVHQIYSGGLQFRTPEAITPQGTFRACTYLRPLAIWALYGILTEFESLNP
ncbi:MAG: bile acid beta-glucosidase [Cyanobacteria bacterium]|nr:bile acid beta-glucosidase [Cyanobacteriota bacterium]